MTARPYILAETNWKTVRATPYEVAILPWGATEAHNYHLPYFTDVMQCDAIAARAAQLAWEQNARVIALPTVPFGANTGQIDIPLTLNMNPSTQLAVLEDIVDSLERQHFRKLVILNGHGGNDFKQMIRELMGRYSVFVCAVNWFGIVPPDNFFSAGGDHANEMETSVMQHIAPHLVLPLEEAGDGAQRQFKIAALREHWVWAQREWTKVTRDTGIGDPSQATPEKGARYLEAVAAKLADFLVELAAADVEDLYE